MYSICFIFANFSLALLIKVLLIKKRVIERRDKIVQKIMQWCQSKSGPMTSSEPLIDSQKNAKIYAIT